MIDDLAGILGIDPRPFSLRQLDRMAQSRQMTNWDHTAAVCATILNVNRDPKKSQPADPAKLNPFRQNAVTPKKPIVKLSPEDSMKVLKQVFIDHKMPDIEALQKK